MQQQRTISQLDCDVQWKVHFIQQLVMTLSMTGPKRSSKAFPKAKFAPKKRSWSLLVVCCPSDPLKLSEKLSEKWFLWNRYIWEVCSANQSHTENCNACSQHWSTEGTQCFFTSILNHTSHNQHFKSWVNWALHFCHIHLTSCQPTTTSSNILTTFCRENASTTSRRQKLLFKSLLNPEAQILFIFYFYFLFFIL